MIVVIQGLVVLSPALSSMSSVVRWRRCWRAAPPSRRSEGLERDGFEDLVSILGRASAQRAADLRLSRRPVSERSGVVDIGLEGKILVGAFAAAAVATATAAPGSASGRRFVATIAVSLVHGYASIDQRANQIVSGTAITWSPTASPR